MQFNYSQIFQDNFSRRFSAKFYHGRSRLNPQYIIQDPVFTIWYMVQSIISLANSVPLQGDTTCPFLLTQWTIDAQWKSQTSLFSFAFLCFLISCFIFKQKSNLVKHHNSFCVASTFSCRSIAYEKQKSFLSKKTNIVHITPSSLKQAMFSDSLHPCSFMALFHGKRNRGKIDLVRLQKQECL